MANVDTNEEFWGITLSKENKTHNWNPAEDEEDIEHKIQVTQACLGVKAKEGERNVIEVTTEDDDGKKMSCAVVSLRVGATECMHLELGFTNPVKFTLKEGNGPISLCGVHLSALPLDFGNEGEEEESSDEDVDESVFIRQEDEEFPSLEEVISGGCAKIEEISDDKVELPGQKTKKLVKEKEKEEKNEVAEEKKEIVKDEKEKVVEVKEKKPVKRPLPEEEKEEKKVIAPKKKKEEVIVEEKDDDDEDDDEDEEDEDNEDMDGDDDDDEDDIDMEDMDSDELGSDDEDDDDDEDDEDDDEDEDDSEEEEEPQKPVKKQAAKVNGVPPKKGGKVNGTTTPAPKAKESANKENATPKPKSKDIKATPKKDSTTPKKNPEEMKTFLLKSPNLPKKFEKFTNFLKNNMKVTDAKTQKDLWEYVQKNKK